MFNSTIIAYRFLAYLQGIETRKTSFQSVSRSTFLAYLQGIETLVEEMQATLGEPVSSLPTRD